ELWADGLRGRGAEEGGEIGEDGVGAGLQVVREDEPDLLAGEEGVEAFQLAAVEAALDVGEGAQVGLRAAGGQAGAALADAPGEGVAFVAASELHLPVGPGALDGIAQQEDEPDAGMVASDPLGGVRPEAV